MSLRLWIKTRILGWQAGARLSPRSWRWDTTPRAKKKWLSSGRRPDYGVVAHGRHHSNLEIVGYDETNLRMPCATASRGGQRQSAGGGRQMYLRIRCYRNQRNAAGSLIWNVLKALTAFSSYRWNAKRARHLSSLGRNWRRSRKLLLLCFQSASADKLQGFGKCISWPYIINHLGYRIPPACKKGIFRRSALRLNHRAK